MKVIDLGYSSGKYDTSALPKGSKPAAAKPTGPDDLHAIHVELARRSLIDFARMVAPSTFVFGAAHLAICSFIDELIDGRKGTKGQVNLSPRAGKSMLASIFLPAYLIGRFPSRRIIHLCNNLDLTRQFAEQLVALLQSDEYREIFPHVELIDVSTGRINYRDRRNKRGEWGRYFVTSIKKATSGHGAHFLLVDDPLTENEASSKLIKDAMWERWSGGFVTRVDPVWNRMLLLGTRWARDDLFGRCIAQTHEDDRAEKWQVLKLPALVDSRQAEKINTIALADPIFVEEMKAGKVRLLEPGGSFAPERFSKDFVERKRAELPPEQFAALYLQEPAPESGIVFQKKMFLPLGKDMLKEVKRKVAYSILTADTAFKDTESSDYTAMLHIGVVPMTTRRLGQDFVQNTLVVLDAYCDRVPAASVPRVIKERYKDWAPREIIIEDAASGTAAIQALRSAGFPVTGFNPRKMPKGRNAKVERANLAAMLIASMPIMYDERNASVQAALQSWLEFPRGDHDDLVDALVTGVLFLRARNEFDSSFDTWANELGALRQEFAEEDDEDDDEADERFMRRPVLERQPGPYGMTPAERHKRAIWLKRKGADDRVDPFESGIEFVDD